MDNQTTVPSPISSRKASQPPSAPIDIEDPRLPPTDTLAIGELKTGSHRTKAVGMSIKELHTHMHICGAIGSGKSTLLEWINYGLAKNGKSLVMIDPHGDLTDRSIKNILTFAPERAEDILLLDFTSIEWSVSLNPLDIHNMQEIEARVASILEMFYKILHLNPLSTPPAMVYLKQALWALCETNFRIAKETDASRLTLLQLHEFFSDQTFRHLVMKFCKNFAVRKTFAPEGTFDQLDKNHQSDIVLPILKSFSTLTTQKLFVDIFGQSKSKIDWTEFVKEQKIVFVKLPPAIPDATLATAIRSLLVPMIIESLSQWGSKPELSLYLMIDELDNCEAYRRLISQVSSRGLYCISSNQVLKDLSPEMLRSIKTNAQSKIFMCLDEQSAKEIIPFITRENEHLGIKDICALPDYWAWADLWQDAGKISQPFEFKTLPPICDEMSATCQEDIKANEEKYSQTVKSSRLRAANSQNTIRKMRQAQQQKIKTMLETEAKNLKNTAKEKNESLTK